MEFGDSPLFKGILQSKGYALTHHRGALARADRRVFY